MCKLVGALFLLGLGAVFGHPAKDKLMIDVGGDTAVVESMVREARQAPEHIEELLQPDKNADGEESKTLYRISGESKEDKKNKNAVDDFDFVYFGGSGGSGKSTGDGATAESDGGKSQSYETNGSYSSGGSSSYEEGDDGESGNSGSGSYSSGGESGSYTSADDEDAEGHEEAEGDDY